MTLWHSIASANRSVHIFELRGGRHLSAEEALSSGYN
jgi:hypothetical protein